MSGTASVSGTLRPNRLPVAPIIGHFKIVVAAVDGAGRFQLLRHRALLLCQLRLFGVVQILLAQLVANLDELGHRGGSRKLVPLFVAGNGVAAHRAHSTRVWWRDESGF